jgi:hypothetical protein
MYVPGNELLLAYYLAGQTPSPALVQKLSLIQQEVL